MRLAGQTPLAHLKRRCRRPCLRKARSSFWKTVIDTMMDGLLVVDRGRGDPGRQPGHGADYRLQPGGAGRPALHHPQVPYLPGFGGPGPEKGVRAVPAGVCPAAQVRPGEEGRHAPAGSEERRRPEGPAAARWWPGWKISPTSARWRPKNGSSRICAGNSAGRSLAYEPAGQVSGHDAAVHLPPPPGAAPG